MSPYFPRAEKFNIISIDHGCKQNCNFFSVSDRKYSLCILSKFGPKIKIISLSWNLLSGQILIYIIQWCCSLFRFPLKNSFWANLILKFETDFMPTSHDIYLPTENLIGMFYIFIFICVAQRHLGFRLLVLFEIK